MHSQAFAAGLFSRNEWRARCVCENGNEIELARKLKLCVRIYIFAKITFPWDYAFKTGNKTKQHNITQNRYEYQRQHPPPYLTSHHIIPSKPSKPHPQFPIPPRPPDQPPYNNNAHQKTAPPTTTPASVSISMGISMSTR